MCACCVTESIHQLVYAYIQSGNLQVSCKLCTSQNVTVMWCLWSAVAKQDDKENCVRSKVTLAFCSQMKAHCVNQDAEDSREFSPVYEDMHRVQNK